LALDSNHDGLLTVEDFLKNFGSLTNNFDQLRKLIIARTNRGDGTMNYQDFSSWVGGAIHQSEGFYFRHDSVRNPSFDRALQKKDTDIEAENM
jgi:hypothetical protein